VPLEVDGLARPAGRISPGKRPAQR